MSVKQPVPSMRRVHVIQGQALRTYGSKTALCPYCGRLPTCSIAEFKQGVWKTQREGLKTCSKFLPILNFRSGKGMEGRFNTFRLGLAWANRLKIDDVVALQAGTVIVGTARVTRVEAGEKSSVALCYADQNHNLLDAGLTPSEAGEQMLKNLRRSYGKLIYEAQQSASVIFLERIHEHDTEGESQLTG